MKNFFFLLATLFAFSNAVSAQNWMTSGNAAAATNFLGTTNNTSLNFRTNNVGRFQLRTGQNSTLLMSNAATPIGIYDSDPNVGVIGLSLDIQRTPITYGASLGLMANTSSAAGTSIDAKATGILSNVQSWYAGGGAQGVNGSISLSRAINNGSYSGGGVFTTALSNANINTATPNYVGGVMGILNGTIASSSNTAIASVLGQDQINTASTWAGYFLGRGYFRGNVGIGTTTPAAKLDVVGEMRVTSASDATRTYRITSGSRQEIYANNDLLTYSGQNNAVILNTITNAAGAFSVYNNNTSGTALFQVNGTTGNVGIGVAAGPSTKLQVAGNATVNGRLGVIGSTTDDLADLVNEQAANTVGSGSSVIWAAYKNPQTTTNPMLIEASAAEGSAGNYKHRFVVRANGQVVMGDNLNTPAGYRLYVQDGILTEKLKVAVKNSANWADYVFAPTYNLRPLEEVETFVKTNKHLPGVPSAEEVVKEGIDMATMDAKLLEKIEELTLYMIELKKQNVQLHKDIQTLKSTISSSTKQ